MGYVSMSKVMFYCIFYCYLMLHLVLWGGQGAKVSFELDLIVVKTVFF